MSDTEELPVYEEEEEEDVLSDMTTADGHRLDYPVADGKWILAVQQAPDATQLDRIGWSREPVEPLVGYVKRVFDTRAAACRFYNEIFGRGRDDGGRPMREIGPDDAASDADPDTRLRFVPQPHLHQYLTLSVNDEHTQKWLPHRNPLEWSWPGPPRGEPLDPAYGTPELFVVKETETLDALAGEYSRTCGACTNFMLEAWRDGRLYGLRCHETDAGFARKAHHDAIFLRTRHGILAGWYVLPCFLVLTEARDNIEMVWVARRAERKGLGTRLVRGAAPGIRHVRGVLATSRGFWDALGITYTLYPH
jgi:GNAT superfamily N-acetyltransferase